MVAAASSEAWADSAVAAAVMVAMAVAMAGPMAVACLEAVVMAEALLGAGAVADVGRRVEPVEPVVLVGTVMAWVVLVGNSAPCYGGSGATNADGEKLHGAAAREVLHFLASVLPARRPHSRVSKIHTSRAAARPTPVRLRSWRPPCCGLVHRRSTAPVAPSTMDPEAAGKAEDPPPRDDMSVQDLGDLRGTLPRAKPRRLAARQEQPAPPRVIFAGADGDRAEPAAREPAAGLVGRLWPMTGPVRHASHADDRTGSPGGHNSVWG